MENTSQIKSGPASPVDILNMPQLVTLSDAAQTIGVSMPRLFTQMFRAGLVPDALLRRGGGGSTPLVLESKLETLRGLFSDLELRIRNSQCIE